MQRCPVQQIKAGLNEALYKVTYKQEIITTIQKNYINIKLKNTT